MKFVVTRTSDWKCKKEPCDGAVLCEIKNTKTKTTEEVWMIEVNSLEDLLELQKEVDEDLVLQEWWHNPEYYEIEIYDTYRE